MASLPSNYGSWGSQQWGQMNQLNRQLGVSGGRPTASSPYGTRSVQESPWERVSNAKSQGNIPQQQLQTPAQSKAPDMSMYAPQRGYQAYRPGQAQPSMQAQQQPPLQSPPAYNDRMYLPGRDGPPIGRPRDKYDSPQPSGPTAQEAWNQRQRDAMVQKYPGMARSDYMPNERPPSWFTEEFDRNNPRPPSIMGTPLADALPAGWTPANPNLARGPRTEVSGDPLGSLAASQDRPPPFSMQAAQTAWGPTRDPFAERDALIQRLGEQNLQRQANLNQTWLYGGRPPQNWWEDANPQLNPAAAIAQSGLAGGSPTMLQNYQGPTWIDQLNQMYGG